MTENPKLTEKEKEALDQLSKLDDYCLELTSDEQFRRHMKIHTAVADQFREEDREKKRKKRRERIATAMLPIIAQALPKTVTENDAARAALIYADALIAELDKEDGCPRNE